MKGAKPMNYRPLIGFLDILLDIVRVLIAIISLVTLGKIDFGLKFSRWRLFHVPAEYNDEYNEEERK